MNSQKPVVMEHHIRQTVVIPILKLVMIEVIITLISFLTRFLSFNYLGEILNNLILIVEILVIQIFNLYLILNVIFSWLSIEYILRNDEIVIREGLIKIKETTYEIANLQSMSINQSLFGRIFNFGTIRLFNPVLKEEIFLEDIPNPNLYGAIIQNNEQQPPPTLRPIKQIKK